MLNKTHLNVASVALAALALLAANRSASGETTTTTQRLEAGVFAVDISPTKFPVIVNGMFEERTADQVVDRLFARAFVLKSGATKIAIVIVDSMMLPRELLDDVKSQASQITGIPTDYMLISATHTHSAPSVMGCLGSRPDPGYPAFLAPLLVRAIQKANDRLEPAQIGWTKVHAPNHTFCRRYIRRPDRAIIDPFGKPTARVNMHPGFLSPDAIGPSGPVDDELSLMAIQSLAGKPLGVLANFSMHYIGSPLLSNDYFGRFAEDLAKRIDGSDGATSCIVAMSQGTSGDLFALNYSGPTTTVDYHRFAEELASIADNAYRTVKYVDDVPLAMSETKLKLRRRVPDAERLVWAKEIAAKVGDRRPQGWPEVYALEQIMLDAEPQRELKLQAIRIGDVGIAAIPDEVFGITGLKIKMQSPLPNTFTIELANGGEGYIPPPEQHKLGGYETWPARTAGLEVTAEPKIVDAVLTLLDAVSGKPRRPIERTSTEYSTAVLQSKPRAYWRLAEIEGNTAHDCTSNAHSAQYEDGTARYLSGPEGDGLRTHDQTSRAPHFAGGRIHAQVPEIGDHYSVEFWFWNGLPNDARDVTGHLCSRGPVNAEGSVGDHLGISGKGDNAGKLFFASDHQQDKPALGRTAIAPGTWNHLVLVRDCAHVRVFLNGEVEIEGDITAAEPLSTDWFFAGRSDGANNFEGKLSEVALYDRALPPAEVTNHYQAAKRPK